MHIKIPNGFIIRPAVMGDLKKAVELFNACSLYLLGVRQYALYEQEVEWKMLLFNLETDTRVVFRSRWGACRLCQGIGHAGLQLGEGAS